MAQSPLSVCLPTSVMSSFLFLFLSSISGANHKTVITDPLWPDFYRGGGTPLNKRLIYDQIRMNKLFAEHLNFKDEYF